MSEVHRANAEELEQELLRVERLIRETNDRLASLHFGRRALEELLEQRRLGERK